MAKNLLKISKDEWKIAKDFFQKNPQEPKLSRNPTKNNLTPKDQEGLAHSFIKVNDTLYAMDHNEQSKKYLGSGGMTEVKLIQDAKGHNFVIKRRKERADDRARHDAIQEEIENEVTVLKRIGRYAGHFSRISRNITTGVEKEKHYTIEPYISGQTLSRAITDKKYQSLSEKLEIAFKLAIAVKQLMHDNGVMHLDIKPSNIMVSEQTISIFLEDGSTRDFTLLNVTLIDFNGSKLINDTKNTSRIFTPGYAETGKLEDFKSDIYSLGVVFGGGLYINDRVKGWQESSLSEIDALLPISSDPKESITRDLNNFIQLKMKNDKNRAERPSIEDVIEDFRKEVAWLASDTRNISDSDRERLSLVLQLEEYPIEDNRASSSEEESPDQEIDDVNNQAPNTTPLIKNKESFGSFVLRCLLIAAIVCTFPISLPIIFFLRRRHAYARAITPPTEVPEEFEATYRGLEKQEAMIFSDTKAESQQKESRTWMSCCLPKKYHA